MNFKRYTQHLVLCFSLLLASFATLAAEDDLNLPSLGDHTSGIISLQQEYALGQSFLRALRAQAPLVSDPILQEYVELLIYRLASYSKLEDRRLEVAIINNKSINAFAVPGGVVGINLGLFLYGESEDETAAILAHELAHLSQRHFARRTEASKKANLATMVGFLAGVVLMATTGSEAGIAAISASQGLGQAELLRYSRSREKEADLVGIDTLHEAGMDPRAMAYMFERLNRAQRFSGRDIPEFLLTHPVTKDRIATSYGKAGAIPDKTFPVSLDYQLMRARVQVMSADSSIEAVARMRDLLNDPNETKRIAANYGLALAEMEAGQLDSSMRIVQRLKYEHPDKIAFELLEAELHLKASRYHEAVEALEEALQISPTNYPLNMAYAEALMKTDKPKQAVNVLTRLTVSRPHDKDVWYMLAEAQGLSRDIIGVHEARAEYFVLVGNFDQAIKQLGFATPLVKSDFQQTAKIRARIQEIFELKTGDRT